MNEKNTKDLLKRLREIADRYKHSPERARVKAEEALLEFIDDPYVTATYESVIKY